ncbi:MAG: VOC family protein [Pseudomonadota bacterium]
MKHAVAAVILVLTSACQSTPDTPMDTPLTSDDAVERAVGIKGVRYVMSSVSDIDRTLDFYQQSVNFDLVKRYQIDATQYDASLLQAAKGPADVALIKTPTVYIKLVDFNLDSSEPGQSRAIIGPGYTHICFQSHVDNSAFERFRQSGLKVITRGGEPADRGYGTAYAYGTDLDGTMIELEVQENPRRNETDWIGHVANATPDLERMLKFYEMLLGYPTLNRAAISNSAWADSVGDIDGLEMQGGWSVVANLGLEFWQFDSPKTPERNAPATLDAIGYNYVAFEVGDLDSEIVRLSGEGVTFAGSPINEQGWKIAFGYDPDGTLFSLQQNVSAARTESIDDLLWIDRSKLP